VAHFTQDNGNWRIDENLRRMVSFRQFNLLDSYGWLDDLDVVFCRNVLIYFDRQTQLRVLERLCQQLVPGGYLFLGHSDSLTGLDLPLLSQIPSVYRKAGAGVTRKRRSTRELR